MYSLTKTEISVHKQDELFLDRIIVNQLKEKAKTSWMFMISK